MPLAGLEPARIATPDFESGASAIPPQRQRVLHLSEQISNNQNK